MRHKQSGGIENMQYVKKESSYTESLNFRKYKESHFVFKFAKCSSKWKREENGFLNDQFRAEKEMALSGRACHRSIKTQLCIYRSPVEATVVTCPWNPTSPMTWLEAETGELP